MTTTSEAPNGADGTPDTGPDHDGSLLMLPGLAPSRPKVVELTEAAQLTIAARRDAGLLTDLDAAHIALILADATKLDATVGVGRPSGRAKLLSSMSETLAALPEPEQAGTGLLRPYLTALLDLPDDDDADTGEVPLPKLPPPPAGAGVTEAGVITTLRARHDAGLSTQQWAVHERLALVAARDLDRALTVGAPSGYALLASTMQSIIDRLPRPTTTADATTVHELLATIEDQPSPFTALPPAAHHPERDPEWLSEGAEIAAIARAMGRHLMPWQRKAIDVATEYRLDSAGRRRYRYSRVLITVPRQSGKTDLTVPVLVHRALTRTAACWYTAQTGQDARKRMMELLERVEGSLLQHLLTSTRSNGAEGVRVTEQTGSHVTRFSPTFSALHGEHPHLVVKDEIWHYSRELGDALDGAVEPAQITLGALAQHWDVSTMGTASSDYLNGLVDTGRAGTDPDLCYIEYSLPDGLDPMDPDNWPLFHPALGNTIAVEDLAKRARKALDSPARRATWLRAYCNRVVASDGSLVDLALWDDLAMDVPAPAWDDVALAMEVAPGNAAAAILAAWTDARTGRPAVRIVRQEPGTKWLVPYMDELLSRGAHGEVAVDGAGPIARFAQDLEALGHEVRRLNMSEYGQATEALLDYAGPAASLIHDGSDELREQMGAAEVRRSNGVRRFSRDTARPTPAVIAAAVALHAHQHPAEQPAESIVL